MDVLPSGHDQGRSIVTGDIDLANASDLLVRLTGLIGSARRNIGLNPYGVIFIDCAGLRTPAAVNTHVRASGAGVRLTATSPVVVLLLGLAGAIHDTTSPAGGPAYAAARRTLTTDRPPPV